jgi:phospholipase C
MTNSNNQLGQINHIVVLMLENRSFDNVLGWLYDSQNAPPFNQVPPGQTFEGLSGKTLCNPRPGGGQACVGRGSVMTDPYPDPNEPYDPVYMQMYNPPTMPNPIPNTTDSPGMQGFVINYADAINQAAGALGSGLMDMDPGLIMNCFTPDKVPVLSGLANAYAVCDHWFCSVPTQTLPNRSFVHAATSSGYVYNSWKTGKWPWDVAVLVNDTPTVFNLLEGAEVSWRIYYGGPFLLCNAFIGQDQLAQYATYDPATNRFFPMSQFFADAAAPVNSTGTDFLPSYSFIEPNFMCSTTYGPENDEHPAFATLNTGAPTNVLYGEALIYSVYQALKASPNWDSTLLVITFDEHGGCYDHVPTPPPPTVSPDGVVIPPDQPGGSGFIFNRFGVRVPAVLVSPLIKQGIVCNTLFDHTSIIKTVTNRWNLASLTKRDAAATDVSEVLTLPKPRKDSPTINPRPVPLFTDCAGQTLSDLQKALLAGAARRVAESANELMELSAMETTEHVTGALDEREARVRQQNS